MTEMLRTMKIALTNWAFWIALLFAFVLSGCAHGGSTTRVSGDGSEHVEFVVHNANWADARVYILSPTGVSLGRISHAASMATTTKRGRTPPSAFHIYIELFAEDGAYMSDLITWADGCVLINITNYLPLTTVQPCHE